MKGRRVRYRVKRTLSRIRGGEDTWEIQGYSGGDWQRESMLRLKLEDLEDLLLAIDKAKRESNE